MNLNEYMRAAERTWQQHEYPQMEVPHVVLGLVGEAGEVAELFKKAIRGDGPINEQKLIKELGDVAYYWVTICRLFSINPEAVLAANIAKLADRQARGVIKGSGDDR